MKEILLKKNKCYKINKNKQSHRKHPSNELTTNWKNFYVHQNEL